MQTTSATWKSLWAAGAKLETRATIGGTTYTEMTNPVVTRSLTPEGMTIGNAVSATCQISLLTSASIARAATVTLEMRLTDGTTTSEWLPVGTYYISRRQRDPINGLLTLECYDALLKANAVWSPSSGAWPRTMSAVASELATLLGVTMDARTQIASGSAYVITEPVSGTTIRDVLGEIACANAGNWVITPAGELRLVPVVSAAGASSATQNVVDVDAITGSVNISAPGTVTGVRYGASGDAVILGDDTGLVIETGVGAVIASDLYNTLVGMTYQPYVLSGAIYDPAAELGDYVRAGANGELASVLDSETAVYGALYHADILAPQAAEMSDEYPYIDGAANKALMASKVYTAQQVAALDSSLDQASIFNRLTDNGAAQGLYMVNGQLYVNMSYARAGTLILGGANNQNGLMQVQDANGNTVGQWDNNGISLLKGAIEFKVDNDANNVIRINGEDNVSAFRRAFVIRYLTSGMSHPIKTTLDRGVIMIDNDDGGVTYGYTAITPGGIVLDSASQMNNVNVDLRGTSRFTLDGATRRSQTQLLMSNARVQMQYRDAQDQFVDWFDLNVRDQTMALNGSASFDSVSCRNGASGSFTTADGKTVTVTNGIITSIVGNAPQALTLKYHQV